MFVSELCSNVAVNGKEGGFRFAIGWFSQAKKLSFESVVSAGEVLTFFC